MAALHFGRLLRSSHCSLSAARTFSSPALPSTSAASHHPAVLSKPSCSCNFAVRRMSAIVCRRGMECAASAAPAETVSKTELLEAAKAAVQAGAAVVLEAVDKPRKITLKGATDLVTETDQASEDAILKVLKERFPDHAFLGEEGGVSGNTASDYLWCCDPLDGTTNFAHSYPSFAVSVAVLRHSIPLAGCVVEFSGGPGAWVTKLYSATRNGGAFLNDKPISVSRTDTVARSLLTTGFGYEHDEAWAANLELFKEFTDESQGVRRLGAAAVDLCHVATGIIDGYWEYRLKPWDVAAGVLMVEEAGGRVTTMDGLAYSVFDRSLLATNDALYEGVLNKTRPKTQQLLERGVDLSPWFIPEGYRVHTGQQL